MRPDDLWFQFRSSTAAANSTAPKDFTYLTALDHIPDPSRQRFNREGLGDHLHAGVEEAIRQSGILGVACDEQYLQVRTRDPRLICKLAPVDSGQPDICDKQVNALARLQDLEARSSIGSLQRAVTQFEELRQSGPE